MDEFFNAINKSLDVKLHKFKEKLKFDYTITAKVLSFNGSSGTYVLLHNGSEFQAKAREGLVLKPNDLVYIRIVKGNFRNRFIDCKKP